MKVDTRGENALPAASIDKFQVEAGLAEVALEFLDAFLQRVDQSRLTPPLLQFLQEGWVQVELIDAGNRTLIRESLHDPGPVAFDPDQPA